MTPEKKTGAKDNGAPRLKPRHQETAPGGANIPYQKTNSSPPTATAVAGGVFLVRDKKLVSPVRNHGRRKTAVARVWLSAESDHSENGSFARVNDKPIAEYFPGKKAEILYLRPFQIAKAIGKYSASIKVEGGGVVGQLEAVVHGLARALVETNPSLRGAFKKEKLLTRDSRMKERKKYGLRRARRRQQWSKR